MTQKEIDRINELFHKSKTVGLTEEEKAEQKELRIKYINGFKQSLVGHLEGITVVEKDGSRHKLNKKSQSFQHKKEQVKPALFLFIAITTKVRALCGGGFSADLHVVTGTGAKSANGVFLFLKAVVTTIAFNMPFDYTV